MRHTKTRVPVQGRHARRTAGLELCRTTGPVIHCSTDRVFRAHPARHISFALSQQNKVASCASALKKRLYCCPFLVTLCGVCTVHCICDHLTRRNTCTRLYPGADSEEEWGCYSFVFSCQSAQLLAFQCGPPWTIFDAPLDPHTYVTHTHATHTRGRMVLSNNRCTRFHSRYLT